MNATMKEKILVTGGAGFIGTHVVQKLLETKDNVHIVILDNFSVGKADSFMPVCTDTKRLDIVKGDVRDEKILDEVLSGITTVYHLAAVVGVDRVISMPQETWDVEVNGTKMLIEKCIQHKVKRFFLASSSECYGEYSPGSLPMKESDYIMPNTNYGKAKYECEKVCEQYNRGGNISCVAARYFNVYGKLQSFNGYVIPNMVVQALNNEPIKIYGHGDQLRDFMYIDDTVDATIKLTESELTGVYNIGSGKCMSIKSIAETIIKLADSDSMIVHVPIRRPTDIESKLSDNAKIRESINWELRHDINAGLKETINSYRRYLNECNCNMRTSG
ncbi:MAG: GDP-mannose 4,6-dehydratase [Candidatus Aenigmarchaeota archaeon]|nr:GDP-mannose 4,6-dehydratase [Candidatus Aenigmarchaeota archaeon]